MFTTQFIATIFAALYLTFIAQYLDVSANWSRFVFKFIPQVLAFVLVLVAFKII